jgi:tetratricopeptide (TPR) repeat protein
VNAGKKAVELDPEFQLAKNNLEWAGKEKKRVEQEVGKLESKAGKLSAEDEITRGLLYFKLGSYDKCIGIWTAVALENPDNTVALNNIGTAFMMKLQYNDAIVFFKKALEIDPANQLAKNNLAWARDESGG